MKYNPFIEGSKEHDLFKRLTEAIERSKGKEPKEVKKEILKALENEESK